MAINMGLMLISFIIILITVCCISTQEHMSNEDINVILDKLITQTKSNETDPDPEVLDRLLPSINPQAGTSKISRKSFMETENQNRVVPQVIYGDRHEGAYTEFKSGNVDENYFLNNLANKDIVSDYNTIKENKQISFNQHAQQNQQLSLLHDYPEIIIDHITYDDDETDKEYKNRLIKIKATHDVQHIQNVVKGEKNGKTVNLQKPILKTRYTIPEEEIQIIDRTDAIEHVAPRNYLTAEMKGLIEAIIQKKAMHDTLLKQTTESESRKQNILLEKILQKLPDNKQANINVHTSYSNHQERLSPSEIEVISRLRSSHHDVGHHLTNPYSQTLLTNNWGLHNRLLSTLLRMTKPEALKRYRFVASLIDRMMSKVNYRPMFYDLYRK